MVQSETSIAVKEKITLEVRDFVEKYTAKSGVSTKWGKPLVGFADAAHPYILALKQIIGPTHGLPTDVLNDASTVIVCYVPFTRELARTNAQFTRLASPQWALSYEQTNAMFGFLNAHLIGYLQHMGYRAAVPKEALTFDRQRLISNWSHRHFAYAAGLGTFGINNMLITKSGCCGRFSSLVTNLDVIADDPICEDLCLYKKNKRCGICVLNCPMGALSASEYDRHTCYALLRENATVYTQFGSSYANETGSADGEGSEVCAKCITASPCAFWDVQ